MHVSLEGVAVPDPSISGSASKHPTGVTRLLTIGGDFPGRPLGDRIGRPDVSWEVEHGIFANAFAHRLSGCPLRGCDRGGSRTGRAVLDAVLRGSCGVPTARRSAGLDGRVWYTAQLAGALGVLDPATGQTHHIPLGAGSRPHGVIVGPDGAPWITDGGLNAIVRVDPVTEAVTPFPLPAERPNVDLNTATFDLTGRIWFTGHNGFYGVLAPSTGVMNVFDAPVGPGTYGMTTTPTGGVYYASLESDYVGQVNLATGGVTVLHPPTANNGARRVWSDSQGRVWVSEWDGAQVARFDPTNGQWKEWRLPGVFPRPYAVYVDEQDKVWLTDFTANAFVRFDPPTEEFDFFPLPSVAGEMRQLLGRNGEVWGAESRTNRLVVLRRVDNGEVADFNADGLIDGGDLSHLTLGWKARFGAGLTGSDFLLWQRQVGSTVPPPVSAGVPEPNSSVGTLLAVILLTKAVRKF